MSAPQHVQAEPASLVVARLTVEAVWAAEAARAAFRAAMAGANERSVVVPGWITLQQADAVLAQVVNPHGQLRSIAENEIRANGGTS